MNGPQWSDIDSNFILRKTQTKTGAYVEFDLKLYPAILEEIDCVAREKRIGRKHWRAIQAPDVHPDLAQGGRA